MDTEDSAAKSLRKRKVSLELSVHIFLHLTCTVESSIVVQRYVRSTYRGLRDTDCPLWDLKKRSKVHIIIIREIIIYVDIQNKNKIKYM